MRRAHRWDEQVPCPRTVDGEPCEGYVRVHGYEDGGNLTPYSDNAYPAEGESFVEACDSCGFEDWTEKEQTALERAARSD